ncbi:MAG TPA: sigma-54 dependent transcriptional regulator [Ignavibacteriaceae bacterium]|nr:sigma-54 dependent transcriptional regulator [Ignavibacteriaceae bacterium]
MEKILVIDDDSSIRVSLNIFLKRLGYNIITAENGSEGYSKFLVEKPSLIITDLKMPIMNGYELLTKIKLLDQNLPVIIITAYDDMTSAIKAMELGAYDYIEKPIDIDHLEHVIKRAFESLSLSKSLVKTIDEEDTPVHDEYFLVGKTRAMKEIFKKIGQVCTSKVTVLITGESGTGKELISRIIHYSGITKNKPFIPVNCTALSEHLLESELFGHVKGSFTGAIKDKKGKFELAEDGTIFLDEISEISGDLQVKLLRVLEEKEFEQVGGEHSIHLNARIIAATNKNLKELMEKGKFRKDLYYRLNVFTIDVPPLRNRKEDIPLLVVELIKKINRDLHKNIRKISYDVMEQLQNYSWTGNVRELYNTLQQAAVLTNGDVLEKENVLLKSTSIEPGNSFIQELDKVQLTIEEVEKIYIQKVLNKVNFNKQKACKILGITKPTLNAKIEKYRILLKTFVDKNYEMN